MDAAVLAKMKTANEAKLAELDAKIKDAQDNLGETDVRDAMVAKADYLVEIGDRYAGVQPSSLVRCGAAWCGAV